MSEHKCAGGFELPKNGGACLKCGSRANERCRRAPSPHAEITRLRAEVERLERKNRMHDTVNRDQAESYEKRLEAAEQKAAELQARVDALDAGYTEAIEDISEWAAYASEYFQSKHDLEGCISRHKARLINALNLQHKPTETDLTTKD